MKYLLGIFCLIAVCAFAYAGAQKRQAGRGPQQQQQGLVQVDLYYETLCPFSKRFVVGQLWDAYNQVGSLFRVNLVPYGNARQTLNPVTRVWEFDCQHGARECWGNLAQTCAITSYPNPQRHFPFAFCFMQNSNSPDGLKVVLEQCAEKTGLDANVLKQCMGSTVGNQAQHAYADKTEKLLPQVEYVPWIVLDGAHSDRIQYKASTDLVQLVCDAYKGPKAKPDVCK